MKKKPATKKKTATRNIVLYDFDSIKLNNAALLNDQSISTEYTKFLIEVNNSFYTLFQK